MVKDTKVLILDEATGTIDFAFGSIAGILISSVLLASVDYETGRKIQGTIATEFEDRTIFCIARQFPISRIGSQRVPI